MERIIYAILTRIALFCIYGVSLCLYYVFGLVGRLVAALRFFARNKHSEHTILLIGTFYTRNWCISHVMPLSRARNVKTIYAVVDGPIEPIPNVVYLNPPRWMVAIMGRAFSKFLIAARVAVWHQPRLLMGYHILPGALTALLLARLIGSKSAYQVTAGPIELIGGGAATENFFLKNLMLQSPFIERLVCGLAKHFNLIVVRGETARQFMLQRKLGELVFIVPGSINAQRLEAHDEDRNYDVVSVCRLVAIKQPEHIIEVLARIHERKPDLKAVILGDGPLLPALKLQAEKLGIATNVDFRGHVENVESVLTRSKIFLLTSRSEGLSIAMAEAMAAGVVPVVANVGDLGDLVQNDRTGWLVTPGAFSEYADRICDLLNDPQRLSVFSEAAHRKAIQHNDVQHVADRWEKAIEEVCMSSRPTAIARLRWRGPKWLHSRRHAWDATPSSVKAILAPLARGIHPRWWLGGQFRETLQFLAESQHWPMERSRDYQLNQLRIICWKAMERSRFYRQVFKDAGFEPGDLHQPEDLSGLPIIDSESVRSHLNEMCTIPPYSANVDAVSTGGTSGKPLRFYINADRSAVEYAYLLAGWQRMGYRLDLPQGVFRGQITSADRTGLRHEYDPILRRHYYSNFHMTDENMCRYLRHVAGIGPCYLHVYPSSAAVLARFIERTGEAVPTNVRGILAGSENVYQEDRVRVERVFGVRFFSWYGHTEKLIMAPECEHSKDYHVWPTYGYFELLDKSDRPITTPGERGEIVGTGFINTVVPFIRYRTGDYATYVGSRCAACGREHLLITDVSGHRTQEMLVAGDGSLISWTSLNMHDDTFDRVRQFQFFQNEKGKAVLRLVPTKGFGNGEMKHIHSNLMQKLAGRIDLDIQLTDEISLTMSGKQTYVDQKLDLSSLL